MVVNLDIGIYLTLAVLCAEHSFRSSFESCLIIARNLVHVVNNNYNIKVRVGATEMVSTPTS